MNTEQHLEAIAADSAHFASASAGALAHPIDHLGLDVRGLVAHLGAVYAGVTANTTTPGTEPVAAGVAAEAPDGEAINDWFIERRTQLLETLAGADDNAESATFAGVKSVAWWKRRIAHETAVHRWDVEAALHGVDQVAPLDSDLAADGVDEYLEVSLRYSSRRPDRVYPNQSLHLHRSDGPGEWMLMSDGAGGVNVTHEHGKGDAAVRGPASSLVLWVWGRPTPGVEIFGDESVAEAWRSLAP